MRFYYKRTTQSGQVFVLWTQAFRSESGFLSYVETMNRYPDSYGANEYWPRRCVRKLFGEWPEAGTPWPK